MTNSKRKDQVLIDKLKQKHLARGIKKAYLYKIEDEESEIETQAVLNKRKEHYEISK